MVKALNFKFGWYIHTVRLNKNPLQCSEKRERGRIQRLSKCFSVPHIISGTGKATNFEFGRHIRKKPKSPLKIVEKRERGRIQRLPNFFEYPLLSQERVKLRTLNCVRTFLVPVSIGIKAH